MKDLLYIWYGDRYWSKVKVKVIDLEFSYYATAALEAVWPGSTLFTQTCLSKNPIISTLIFASLLKL